MEYSSTDDYILAHKTSLEEHSFIKALASDTGNVQVLSFARDMAFFVLGFRDLLDLARIQNPSNATDFKLNQHCDEDSEHWLWFLEDLEALDALNCFSHSSDHRTDHSTDNKPVSKYALLKGIWSCEKYSVRQHTYVVASYLLQAKNAEEKLTIIDCLEASFAVFISALNHSTKKSGLYSTLRYFGEEHYIGESEHAAGSWFDNPEDNSVNVANYDDALLSKIDTVFSGFRACFDLWHQTLLTHQTKAQPLDTIAI